MDEHESVGRKKELQDIICKGKEAQKTLKTDVYHMEYKSGGKQEYELNKLVESGIRAAKRLHEEYTTLNDIDFASYQKTTHADIAIKCLKCNNETMIFVNNIAIDVNQITGSLDLICLTCRNQVLIFGGWNE
jgi:ribosomal protein S27E